MSAKEELIGLIESYMHLENEPTLDGLADHLVSHGFSYRLTSGRKEIDLTGVRFGKLVVIERDVSHPNKKQAMWLCKCDCGGEATVRSQALRTGKTKSCGCLGDHKKQKVERNTKLYVLWVNTKGACTNPNNRLYKYSGAKGARVCNEWLNNFEAFKKWAIANGYDENAPKAARTLRRFDENADYCPENCYFLRVPKRTEKNASE